MKNTFIYALKDPDSNMIRYIGKSNNPNKRLSDYHIPQSLLKRTCCSKDEMYDLYFVKKIKLKNIAKLYNCDSGTIGKIFKNYGFKILKTYRIK